MDVTPQELRGSEIKEAFRGFNRDEVDDLLERAAVTIEGLTRQVQDLDARGKSAPPTAERPLPSSRDDADMLQRTLLLAQRAADDAVNDAQAQARQLVEDAEARAKAMVTEAESTARRLAENERRRLEDEINELARRRDVLAANADALEQYVAGYRERVRAAIEADLDSISRDRIDAPSPRPELQEVDVPAARSERPEPAGEQVGAVRPAEPARRETEWPPPANAAAAGAAYAASAPSALRVDDPPSPSSSWLSDVDFATSPPEVDETPAPWERATAEHQPFVADVPLDPDPPLMAATPAEAAAPAAEAEDDLDDDAFFASLREAVRDDAPLGPREEPDTFFEEPQEERRSPFRRRR
jgi:cell division septum initiation protein DivIVA